MDYMSIIAYIPAGRDNRITREQPSRLTGRTDRLNRKAIEEARKVGIPVISSSHGKGYYIAETQGEIDALLRETWARIEELTLKMKHVAAYRQLKPIYDRYQASKDKEKLLRGYEREIILFEAAARECRRLGAVPLPSAERMQAEMDALTARRAALTAERQKARREEQDYAAVRRNVEEFLSPPRQAPARQKDMELE